MQQQLVHSLPLLVILLLRSVHYRGAPDKPALVSQHLQLGALKGAEKLLAQILALCSQPGADIMKLSVIFYLGEWS
jgi:hypothetical protein